MPDYAAQRSTMVDTQLATNEVADLRVRAAMAAIAREQFLPAGKRAMAYCDVPVEVSAGRFLLDPRSFGKLVMLADIQPTDHVLDVGCTTGYSTAVLSLLAKSVVGLEQDADLVGVANDLLPAVGVSNATAVQGMLAEGFASEGPLRRDPHQRRNRRTTAKASFPTGRGWPFGCDRPWRHTGPRSPV